MAFTLPALPYGYAALEPSIDARTMEIHHTKHHNGYVTNLNTAISGHADLEAMSIVDLCTNLNKVPKDIRTAIRNNGGGHFNHSLFWTVMAPAGKGGGGAPTAISRTRSAASSARSTSSRRSSPKRPRPASAPAGRGWESRPTAPSASARPPTRTIR